MNSGPPQACLLVGWWCVLEKGVHPRPNPSDTNSTAKAAWWLHSTLLLYALLSAPPGSCPRSFTFPAEWPIGPKGSVLPPLPDPVLRHSGLYSKCLRPHVCAGSQSSAPTQGPPLQLLTTPLYGVGLTGCAERLKAAHPMACRGLHKQTRPPSHCHTHLPEDTQLQGPLHRWFRAEVIGRLAT